MLDQIECLPHRNYAIIADEAHSSQTGEAALALKEALGAAGEAIETEDDMNPAEAEVRRRNGNCAGRSRT